MPSSARALSAVYEGRVDLGIDPYERYRGVVRRQKENTGVFPGALDMALCGFIRARWSC